MQRLSVGSYENIDKIIKCGYNVGMNNIETTLVKDGNSMAIRIPKTALKLSGISGAVELTVTKNQIVIRNLHNPRAQWANAIKNDLPGTDKELEEWDVLASEALDD